jgi:hypothetical protein
MSCQRFLQCARLAGFSEAHTCGCDPQMRLSCSALFCAGSKLLIVTSGQARLTRGRCAAARGAQACCHIAAEPHWYLAARGRDAASSAKPSAEAESCSCHLMSWFTGSAKAALRACESSGTDASLNSAGGGGHNQTKLIFSRVGACASGSRQRSRHRSRLEQPSSCRAWFAAVVTQVADCKQHTALSGCHQPGSRSGTGGSGCHRFERFKPNTNCGLGAGMLSTD